MAKNHPLGWFLAIYFFPKGILMCLTVSNVSAIF
ncbi:DUF2367 domain-containing protein [Streptococcus uberis]|nr:DUF2367 domain-containing protein [Streptococcus uberis]